MLQVYDNIYQINVPLPNNPLKELHSYLIKGHELNLIIDTGFNCPEANEAMQEGLRELNVSVSNTNVFLTHLHVDHSGLVCSLMDGNNVAYASELDSKAMNDFFTGEFYESIIRINMLSGFPEGQELDFMKHPAYVYRMDHPVDYVNVKQGDILMVGDYEFIVTDLAGHTPGQLGLYEKKHGLMFCGDHILNKITPNIIFWGFEMDSVGVFMDNLRKVKNMEIKHLFSAHRSYIEDYRTRIDELLSHHERRLKEVADIVSEGESNMYDVSAKMTWDFGGGDFLKFPPQQKWFAAGEALAHAEHLYKTGVLKRRQDGGVLYYQKA